MRLPTGEPLRVGRLGRSDVVISQDEQMAPVHFEITWDGAACRLVDKSQRGTEVDGKDHAEVALTEGALIRAGQTQFLLQLGDSDLQARLPPAPRPKLTSSEIVCARSAALEALRNEAGLHVILDAARDRRILPLLQACDDESRSLFDGTQGEAMASGAPHLVRLVAGSELLPVLVEEGWGDAWGIYLTSSRPLREVRQRLRRSLIVRDEETGKRLFFRFYDPRVLRVFWPTCSPRQRSEMLGTEIGGLIFEGEAGEVIRGAGPAL